MPPKSTRVRKTPNREPVSAIATRTAPTLPAPSSSNQLAMQLINLQLLLHDSTITVASGLNDSSEDDENYCSVRPRSASTLLEAHLNSLQQSSIQSSEFEPFEQVIIPDNIQQPIQIEKVTEKLARKFG
jgi:hypothetical protein